MRVRGRALTLGVVLLVLVAAAWLWSRSRLGDPRVHEDGHGVLSATSAGGGVSVTAPDGTHPWSATFGSLLLCVTKRGAVVHLRRVRTEGSPKPIGVRHQLRILRHATEDSTGDIITTPFYSSRGVPPRLSVGKVAGTFRAFGGSIDQPCTGPEGTDHP